VGLINVIAFLFNLWSFAVLARVLLSYLNLSPYHPVVRALYLVTEPILAPLRRVIPPIGMIDITPIVALLLIQLLERLVITALYNVV
jgi:YggT family protein